jgi:uncharacterized membrane protein
VTVVWYSLLRLALFAAVFAVVYLLGAHWALAAVLALIISWGVSYVFLRRLGDAAARTIAQRVESGRPGGLAAKVAEEESREDRL